MMISVLLVFYILIGSIAFIANLVVFIAICRSHELASRYRIILAQISAAAILALATLVAGIGRTIIISMNITSLRSRRYCMLMPWNILFMWAEPMTAVVELIVSTDRLLLISFPVAYSIRPTFFQLAQIFISHIAIGAAIIVSWIASLCETEDICDPICWTSQSMLPFYQYFFTVVRVSTALLSVILYFIAYVLTRRYMAHVIATKKSGRDAALQAFQRRQAQLTVTMGISCIVTLILYVIPICLLFLAEGSQMGPLGSFLTVLSVLTTNINPIPNLVILVWRQTDIASAVKKLLNFGCFNTPKINIVLAVSQTTP
ncbi:hypothetical protein Tcan_03476 [Toxocara canis]|uniref:G-protein coupled receptors family 1 profile domain-containing protein n=1 Tax=Toxocara canis TaxID=6265 RepID=A0A0B2VJP9_TOXCA|nr:hypothetical protein Tcan_03476 [Toxocara canis]